MKISNLVCVFVRAHMRVCVCLYACVVCNECTQSGCECVFGACRVYNE